MSTFRRYLAWLRLIEVTQVSGFASSGILFALRELTRPSITQSFLLFAATWMVYAAVYSFNSYCGFEDDIRNARLSYVKESGRNAFAGSALLFLLASLALYSLLDRRLVVLGAVNFLLWSFYSLPRIGLKHFPLTGTAVHVLTQLLNFQMAFLLLAEVTTYSLLVSAYFALLFAGGHLHHELLDYEADKEAGATTGAIFFGQKKAMRLYAGVFILGGLYWLALGLAHVIRPWELVAFLTPPVLQLGTMVYLRLTREVRFDALVLNRRLYRLYYFLGLAGYAGLKLGSLLSQRA
jgi:4-hydroxybenzoate polyprenyltransferase